MAEDSNTPKPKPDPEPKAAEPTTLQYRFVGSHADTLHNGRPVEPGEFVELTEDDLRDPYIEMLAHDENLIGTDEAGEHQVKLAVNRVERRINNEGEES